MQIWNKNNYENWQKYLISNTSGPGEMGKILKHVTQTIGTVLTYHVSKQACELWTYHVGYLITIALTKDLKPQKQGHLSQVAYNMSSITDEKQIHYFFTHIISSNQRLRWQIPCPYCLVLGRWLKFLLELLACAICDVYLQISLFWAKIL